MLDSMAGRGRDFWTRFRSRSNGHDRTAAVSLPAERLIWPLLLVVLIVTAWLYATHAGKLIAPFDETGYVYGGLGFATTGSPGFEHPYNQRFGPYFSLAAFRVQIPGDPRFFLAYPPGFPLALAVVYRLFPAWPDAPFYVAPAAGVLASLGAFWTVAAVYSKRAGLWAALAVSLDPVMILNGTRPLSDVPGTAAMLLGLALLLAPLQKWRWAQGMGAGLLIGYTCLTRQVNVMVLVGVAGFALLSRHDIIRRGRSLWVGFGVTLAAMGVGLLVYNQRYFGGPFVTGYAVEHFGIPFPMFSWQNFVGNSPVAAGSGYAGVLATVTSDLGIVGLAAALLGSVALSRRFLALILAIALAFALTYAFYFWPTTGNDSRFLLPSLVMLRLLAAVGLDAMLFAIWPRRPHAALVVGLGLVLLLQVTPAARALADIEQRNESIANSVRFVQTVAARTDERAVFISRRYVDHLVLYGHRAAVLLNLFDTKGKTDNAAADAGPRLLGLVQRLLQEDIPVYVIDDSSGTVRNYSYNPLAIVKSQYEVVKCPAAGPPVYRVGFSSRLAPVVCWIADSGN